MSLFDQYDFFWVIGKNKFYTKPGRFKQNRNVELE